MMLYDIGQQELMYQCIFPNSDFKFDSRYKYKIVDVDSRNYLQFPKISPQERSASIIGGLPDDKYFWEDFSESVVDDLKNNKVKIMLADFHEFEFMYIEKIYEVWEHIPVWLRDNMIWVTANSDGNNIITKLSTKYGLPKINTLWSYDMLLCFAALKSKAVKRCYYNLYWKHPKELNSRELFRRLKETSLVADRNKKFTFLTRRPREPRIMFLSLLNNSDYIKDGYVSCPLKFDDPHIIDRSVWDDNLHLLQFCNPGDKTYQYHFFGEEVVQGIHDGVHDLYDNNKLPLVRDTEKFEDWGETNNLKMMWENFTDSYVNFVFETGYLYGENNEDSLPITEKTFKAIIGGQIFLPYGFYGSNVWDKLEELGFKRFRGLNYDYDKVYRVGDDHPYINDKNHIYWLAHKYPKDPNTDYHLQFNLYWQEANRLLSMSKDELKQLWLDNKDIIEHNLYNMTHLEYPKDWVCNYVSVK